jgi:TRAP-type C4-dicarboxylate transport system substrate-binding protein
MTQNKAGIFFRAGLVALTLAVAGCGEEGGPRRIRLSLTLGDTSEWYRGAVKWKQLVEERTNGRYAIEVVPNATRSGSNQGTELQMLQMGEIEASLESTILLSTLEPKWMVFTYPWLFPNHAVANAVCDGPVGEEMLKLLHDRNIVGLAYGVNGFRQITNSKHAIHSAQDLEGLKLGVPQGLPPILFECFGASTHPLNPSGDLDGQENPLSVIAALRQAQGAVSPSNGAAKLHAVQKHLTLWNYVYDPIVLCINRDLWYQLPGDDQKTLRECAHEAMTFERQLVAEADQSLPQKLEAAGMAVTRLTDAEKDHFKAKAARAREFYENSVGKDLLQRFQAAVEEEAERAKAKAREESGQ